MTFAATPNLTLDKTNDPVVPVQPSQQRNLIHVALTKAIQLFWSIRLRQMTNLHRFLIRPIKTNTFESEYFIRRRNNSIDPRGASLPDHIKFAVCPSVDLNVQTISLTMWIQEEITLP